MRYWPALDDAGRAPAGSAFVLPITVEGQPGAPAARSLALDVSYDDGASWRRAHVVRTAHGWLALLRHPGGEGFVSLRATAVDITGNTAEQTIVRAYGMRAR